jgi:hypothetical protein
VAAPGAEGAERARGAGGAGSSAQPEVVQVRAFPPPSEALRGGEVGRGGCRKGGVPRSSCCMDLVCGVSPVALGMWRLQTSRADGGPLGCDAIRIRCEDKQRSPDSNPAIPHHKVSHHKGRFRHRRGRGCVGKDRIFVGTGLLR